MTCSGFEGNCKDPFADPFSALPKKEEKVPLMPGMDIKSKGKASMDPKTLYDKQTPPAPGPLDGPVVMQQPHGGAQSSLGHQLVPPPEYAPSAKLLRQNLTNVRAKVQQSHTTCAKLLP